MNYWDVFKVKDFKQAHGLDEERVRELVRTGKLQNDDCIRRTGERDWRQVKDARAELLGEPAPVQQTPSIDPDATKPGFKTGAGTANVSPSKTPIADPKISTPRGKAFLERLTKDVAEPSPLGKEKKVLASEDEEAPAIRRKRSHEIEEFDLTPMVDMTFLLNLFFMLTASYSMQKSIELPPPNPDQSGAKQQRTLADLQDSYIIVQILPDNRVLVDEEETALELIAGKMQNAMRTTGRNELIIKADDESFHDTSVKVYDAAQAVGLQRIHLASTKRSQPP